MFGKVERDSFTDIFESPLFEDRLELSHGFRSLDLLGSGGVSPGSSSSQSSSPSLLLPFNGPAPNSRQSSIKQCFSFAGRADESRLAHPHHNSSQAHHQGSLSLAIGSEKKLGLQQLNANVQALANASANSNGAKVNTSRYKTELCRPFQEHGTCKYGEKCQFAHGMAELRTVARHPKYKTDLCRTYHSVGFCPYGPRCHFVHNLEEVTKGQTRSNTSANGLSLNLGERNGSVSSNCSSASSDNGSVSPKLPPLPMFSQLAGGAPCGRTRNCSELSGGSLSSPESNDDLAGSPMRLPVFTHLSK